VQQPTCLRDGAPTPLPILSVMGDDITDLSKNRSATNSAGVNVPSFLPKYIKQAFMYPICKPRIFLLIQTGSQQGWASRGSNSETCVFKRTLYRDPSAPTEHPSSKYPILANDSRNTTRAQPRRTASNEFGEGTEELTFGKSRFQREEMCKNPDNHSKARQWDH